MKKLIAMIGAVATAFGLYAADPIETGLSFEGGEVGVVNPPCELDTTATDDGNLLWIANGATATVKGYESETPPAHTPWFEGNQAFYLDVETDGAPLFRTFANASNIGTEYQGDPTNYVDVGVFMDVNVKFTAGEEAPAVGDGTKLAVWAQVIEGDDATTTNLVVTCGQLNEEGVPTPTNLVLDTSALTTDLVGAWHRVTILSMIDDPDGWAITYFRVYVDGIQVGAINGDAFAEGAADIVVSAANKKYVTGVVGKIPANSLFPSMIAYTDGKSGLLSMVGFQGAGQIDDLWLGVGSPFSMDVTVVGLTNADIVSLKADGEVVEGDDGVYTVPSGANLEIFLKAKAGYLFADGTDTATWEGDAADEIDLSTLMNDATKAPFAIIISAAETNYYNTFAVALDVAAAGATIQLCDDFAGQLAVTAGKDIIFDLNGKTITYDGTAINVYGTLVISNGSVNAEFPIATRDGAAVTVLGGTYTGVEAAIWLEKNSALTIKDGTFVATDNAVIRTQGNAGLGGNTITIDGGTFNGSILSDGYIACGIYVANDDTVTVNGGTFNITKGCGICARAGVTTVNGGTFNVSGDAVGGVGDKKIDIPCETFVFDNSVPPYPGYNSETDGIFVPGTSTVKANKDFADFVEEGYKTKVVDNYYVVTPETPFAIIIASDPVTTNFYETLAEAVEEADANNYTITVLANVAIEKTEIAGKKIELTADEAVTITGQLRAVDSADLTIGENITLTTDKHPALFVIGDKNNKGERTTAGTPTTVVIDGKVIGTNATFDETFAISGNGNDVNGVNLTVNGEVSNANGTAIYWPNPGTLTVNGHVAGYSAIVIKDGALVVNDGAYIEATGDNYQALPLNRDGSTPTADAIVGGYYPLSYGYGVPTITVKGGMIKCVADGATSIQGYDHESVAAPADAKNNIAVSGGDFFLGLLVADYLAEGFTLGEISGSSGYASVAQSAQPLAIVITENGTVTNEYSDLHEALVAGKAAGAVVELIDNVDLKNKPWEPIEGFRGTFDGKDFTISNFAITEDVVSGDYAGLFSETGSGVMIRNLKFVNVSISATGSQYVGTIVGLPNTADHTTMISNITVTGSVNIHGKKYVGAFIGQMGCAGICDLHVDGGSKANSTIKTDGKQCGGIVGTSVSGSGGYRVFLYNCSAKNLTITGPEQLGGLTGRGFIQMSFINCEVENVDIIGTKTVDPQTAAAFIGEVYNAYGEERFVFNCTATGVTTKNGEDTTYREFAGPAMTKTAVGTGVAGNNLKPMNTTDLQLTAGTFTTVTADEVDGLKAQIAQGYGLKDNGDNTYTIVPVFNVTIDDQIVNGTVAADKTTAEAGETITLTVTADQGFKLDTIAANGGDVTLTTVTEGTTYTFVMPAAAVTVTAVFEEDAQPLDPEVPTPSKEPAADAAKMNENGSVKPEFIKVPTGAVAADYAALFVAVPGNDVVTIELNEDGTNTLQQSANAVEAQVAAQLANISTATEITVAPAAKDIVPGFYYGLAATADVTTMKNANPAQWKRATTEGIDGGLTAGKPSTAKGFFQIKVSVKAPVTENPAE